MYAITGITGKVGGAIARSLLAERLLVRAVLRDEAKAAEWRTRGCDIALAEMDDAASLTSAFSGAVGGAEAAPDGECYKRHLQSPRLGCTNCVDALSARTP